MSRPSLRRLEFDHLQFVDMRNKPTVGSIISESSLLSYRDLAPFRH
jgi:hypothetical protein